MRPPLSLRIARLLLVAAAAAAIGCIAVIASRASALSPWLAFFVAAAVLYALAASSLERDAVGGRLLAVAGALTFCGIAVLAGFGAGDVTFPAAGLAVLASWASFLHPPRRGTLLAFLAYVAVGVILLASRGAFFLPFAIGTLFIWPLTVMLGVPALGLAAFFVPFGAALAVVGVYLARRRGAPVRWGRLAVSRRSLVAAASGGAVAVTAFVALALARPSTSARFELEPLPLVVLFAAGACAAFGATSLRASPALSIALLTVGAGVLLYAFFARPTVECHRDGVTTNPGPWWLATGGSLRSEGGTRPSGGHGGFIRRDDGVVIRYTCEGDRVTTFAIER